MADEKPNDSKPALRFETVGKTFKGPNGFARALDSVSLTAPRGGITGLVGPDGAGKTTLMRLAAGLLLPDSGRIQVLDVDVVQDPLRVQRVIGYMPQHFGLYEDLSVRENFDLYADLQGMARSLRKQRYEELLELTGLAAFGDRRSGRLSGGMKQKLGLVCTLIGSPDLMLLDEPTAGVDPAARRELWAILMRLVKQEELSVFLSTTYLDEAERCNVVSILQDGRVIFQGDPGKLSDQQRGKTFLVRVPDTKRRVVRQRLAQEGNVLDALIQGDGVRTVMKTTAPPDLGRFGIDGHRIRIDAVAPRFEDGYIALLKTKDASDAASFKATAVETTGKRFDLKNEAVIEVRRIQKRFGDFVAVKNVSFEVNRGEVFGLLGANGAGKTTTFRMLCGLLPPSEGHLRVAGFDLRREAAKARARIGYMSQHFSLYGQLTVIQNLQFFGSAYNLRGPQKKQRIQWALEQFGLAARAEERSGDMPLGYKQRLALVCALVHEPEILFLDEPTAGVDPAARREFWGRINQLVEKGITVLFTTHFMEEAEYCDRLALMLAGKIIAMGSPSAVRERAERVGGEASASMEEAFIALIEHHASKQSNGGAGGGS